MGKSGNLRRAKVKQYSRELGFKENEFGELRASMSKAEARERWLNRYVEQVKARIHAARRTPSSSPPSTARFSPFPA